MKLSGCEEDRRIMQNGGERKQEDINSQLPSTPKENEEESAISTKCNFDLQDQGLVRDRPDTADDQEMVEMRKRNFGKSTKWGPVDF